MLRPGNDDKKDYERTINNGYYGNPIVVFESKIKKQKKIVNFWNLLSEHKIIDEIKKDLDKRVDDECSFFMRFNKQDCYGGILRLCGHKEDPIVVRAKIAVYPADRESALETLNEYFGKIKTKKY